jgi:hypothetical protein
MIFLGVSEIPLLFPTLVKALFFLLLIGFNNLFVNACWLQNLIFPEYSLYQTFIECINEKIYHLPFIKKGN